MLVRRSLLIPAALCGVGLLVVAGFLAVTVGRPSRPSDKPVLASVRPAKSEVLVKPPLPADDYIGAAACRTCHQTIWDRYQSHPMSNSSASTAEATPLEDFDQNTSFTVSTSIGEIEYRVEKTAEGIFHHESLTDPILGSVYDQRVRVDYSIGSGRHGRSYVFAQDDCLFMSPITWYSEESKWELSPNYRPGKHPRFERRILLGCLVCHTERVSVNREAPTHFSSPAIHVAKIGCESCHGPGASHIAFRERSQSAEQASTANDPIINPAKLDPERRESVCWQCHLAAEERITRYGRLDSDFRPGARFDDIWIAFGRGLRLDEAGTMRVASHVEQTRASVCFQRSDGRFGCLSCHDAHSAPTAQDKVAFYRDKCLACHVNQGCALEKSVRTQSNPADSCIDCHMPSHGLNRIPHTSRTDHRVLRHPQPEILPNRDLPLSIFNPDNHKLPQIEEDRAWGLVLAKFAYLQQNVEIAREANQKLAAVQPFVPDDKLVLEWLGVSEQLINRLESARNRWLQILEQLPHDEGALQRLADLQMSQSNLQATKETLTNYLTVNPWQSSYQLRLAAVFGDLGMLDDAARQAKESLRINPTLASAHRILAEVYRRQGKHDESEFHQTMCKRLEPLK
jgi:hypothetical protein